MRSRMEKKITIEELKRRLYLYEHQEVILTGRTAVKNRGRRKVVLFEIRPHDPNHAHQFKKWVRLNDLYEVRPTNRTFYASEDLVEAVRRVVKQKEKENNNAPEQKDSDRR